MCSTFLAVKAVTCCSVSCSHSHRGSTAWTLYFSLCMSALCGGLHIENCGFRAIPPCKSHLGCQDNQVPLRWPGRQNPCGWGAFVYDVCLSWLARGKHKQQVLFPASPRTHELSITLWLLPGWNQAKKRKACVNP